MEKKNNLEQVHQSLDEQYYQGVSLIPDDEFDVLDDQITIPLDPLKKEKHIVEMGSMPKIRDEKELERFKKMYKKHRCFLEPKLDGAGIELIYKFQHNLIISGYELISAISRGVDEGKTGRNVLPMVNMVRPHIPQFIYIDDTRYGNILSIRCEYVFKKETFKQSKSVWDWKHIRGAATGLLLKDELTYAHTLPSLVYYSIMNENEKEIFLKEKQFKLPKINTLDKFFVDDLTISQLQNYLDDCKEYELYPVDGIVIRLDDNSKGLKGRYAYKPKRGDIKFTEIEEIIWQISRQGRLNPVAKVKPVMFEGSVVSKVTLNNIDYINKLNLGIGSVVEIQKAGDIIPEIVKNVTTENVIIKPILIPTKCPYCGSVVYKEDTFAYCSNIECKERIIQSLVYVFQEVFKLKGFGYAYCQALVERFNLKKPLDLFKIKAEELLTFASYESTNKNLSSILYKYFQQLSVHKIALRDAYMLLCLPYISRTNSDKLAALCPTSHEYLKLLQAIVENNLPNKYAILPTNVLKNFVLNKDLILEMFSLLNNYIRLPKIAKLTGKRFCITGSCSKPRNDIVELIEFNGGTFSNTVSKATDLLFIGNNPGQTKMSKAIQYQIKTMALTDKVIKDLINEEFEL